MAVIAKNRNFLKWEKYVNFKLEANEMNLF